MKMRGMTLLKKLMFFPILEKYPKECCHARIGKQLYKGVHLDAFQACVDNTKLKLYYNGDITR
jgi:hypothetical protein